MFRTQQRIIQLRNVFQLRKMCQITPLWFTVSMNLLLLTLSSLHRDLHLDCSFTLSQQTDYKAFSAF